jgi:uncharacterized protein (TIGR04255 family)
MTRRQYPNPPIVEAVCEFRFDPGVVWNLTVPGLFYGKVRDLYTGEPQQQNLIATEFQLGQVPENSELKVTQGLTKLLFPSTDGTKLVGVGPDTLSIHSLRPYEGWNDFSSRIDQSFQVYSEVAKPIGVNRIAIRYINQIAISVNEAVDLSEYFTIYPQLPDGVPSKMSGFVTRTESIYEDIPIRLAITLSDDGASSEQVVFILDLEVYQTWIDKSLPLKEMLSNLSELKSREGQVFESLITDRTRELFDVK